MFLAVKILDYLIDYLTGAFRSVFSYCKICRSIVWQIRRAGQGKFLVNRKKKESCLIIESRLLLNGHVVHVQLLLTKDRSRCRNIALMYTTRKSRGP